MLIVCFSLVMVRSLAVSASEKEQENRWYVYHDADTRDDNHGFWNNYMPESGGRMIVIEEADRAAPYSGATSLMIGVRFEHPWWCGIVVTSAPSAWGTAPNTPAFDLGRATKLVFHARGEMGGEAIQVKVAIAGGNPYGDSAQMPFDTGWIRLEKEWRRYELPVDGTMLGRVITPFVLVTNRAHNPSGHLKINLDDIYFELGEPRKPEPETHPAAPLAHATFFQYLVRSDQQPALVAFNPSVFDPRLPEGGAAYPAAAVRADLASLRPAFDGLVLYSYREDVTPQILQAASELGYRAVLLGIWDPTSVAETEGVARLTERYYGTLALAVVIGNEGIIDHRYGYDDLDAAAERLRALLPAGVQVPLSTSEPIGDYGFSRLRQFGSFLAPNIHPAIDRTTLDPAGAAAWVRDRAATLARVAGKPVLVKETGIPNGGGIGFTPARQRDFWQAYLDGGRLVPVPAASEAWVSFAAAFEAFDAPWKAEKTETPFEGRWGLLTQDRRPYPAYDVWDRRE
jgi:exo-beta-1,3-glucanase (GH17 family)